VVVVGEVLWDLLPSGARLGGAPTNLGICLARLGRPVALVSSVGVDAWGERTRAELLARQGEGAEELDTSLLQAAEGVPTGLVEVSVNSAGVPVYTIAQPAAWDRIEATAEAEKAVRAAQAVCFGTLAQRDPVSQMAIRRLVGSAGAGCLRVLDVNVRAPFFSEEVARWSLAHADLVKISEEELDLVARVVGLPGLADDRLEAIAGCGRGLLAAYSQIGLLAITMGPRGSLLLTGAGADHHSGFPVSVVDTVGAGDAFTAGLVFAWLANGSLRQVNEVGNLCGSFVAGQAGAAPVFPDTLLRRVRQALRG
jgi:fructokinase